MSSRIILVVHDNPRAEGMLRQALENEGFKLQFVSPGEEAVKLAKRLKPVLALIDLDFPNMNSFKIVHDFQQNFTFPLIILAPGGEVTDKVLGLEVGADDYLAKPFHPRELLARIRAILRRVEEVSSKTGKQKSIRVGEVELDPGAQKLTVGTVSCLLTTTETLLLKILMENKGRILSREQILNSIWGEEFAANPRVVDVYISGLRKRCFAQSGAKQYIRGIRGAGYRFEELEGDLSATMPSLPFSGGSADRRDNIPYRSLPFVGREQEMELVIGTIREPSGRLLTLVGPGGIGKTRLACQAAVKLVEDFSNGVCFVNLGAAASARFLVPAIADSVNFSFYGDQAQKTQLLNYLQKKEMLLVMDNFEHLLDGADFLSEILDMAPGIKLLATSREKLNLREESILEVGGLDVSENQDAAQSDAVLLFIQSARKMKPHFMPSNEEMPFVVRLCRILHGSPLGIELAAGWIQILSCKDILSEIEKNLDFLSTSWRNMPERHKSLRATFESSWSLLSDEEKHAFMRLSIFQGGFSREAAEFVAQSALSLILTLTNKSLIYKNPSGRYEIFETLRQYAREKLLAGEQEHEETRDRHSRYYIQFLHERQRNLKRENQKEALDDIRLEIENIREAWNWAVKRNNEKEIDKALEPLFDFYMMTSRFQEGAEAFGQAEMNMGDQVLLSKLSAMLGVFAYRLSYYDKAKERLEKTLVFSRERGNRNVVAFSLNFLGLVYAKSGDQAAARRLLEESLSMYTEMEDRSGMVRASHDLGTIFSMAGEYPRARQLFQNALTTSTEIGDRFAAGIILINLGISAYFLGDYEESRAFYRQALLILKEFGSLRGMAMVLNNLGGMARKFKEYEEAEKLFQEAYSISREVSDRYHMAITLASLGEVAYDLGLYEKARSHFMEGLNIARETGATSIALWGIFGMAGLLMKEEKLEPALLLISFILHHPAAEKEIQNQAKSLLSTLELHLLPDAFKRSWTKGQEANLEEVVRVLV